MFGTAPKPDGNPPATQVETTPQAASSSADMELDSVAPESKQSSELNKRFFAICKQKQQKRAQKAAGTPEAGNLPDTEPSSLGESNSRHLVQNSPEKCHPKMEIKSACTGSSKQPTGANDIKSSAKSGTIQQNVGKILPAPCQRPNLCSPTGWVPHRQGRVINFPIQREIRIHHYRQTDLKLKHLAKVRIVTRDVD